MILIGFYASSFMKFGYFRRNSFFGQNKIILRGKKRTALFQTYNLEKSSFFSTRSCMYLHRYTQIRDREGIYAPLPTRLNRVNRVRWLLYIVPLKIHLKYKVRLLLSCWKYIVVKYKTSNYPGCKTIFQSMFINQTHNLFFYPLHFTWTHILTLRKMGA